SVDQDVLVLLLELGEDVLGGAAVRELRGIERHDTACQHVEPRVRGAVRRGLPRHARRTVDDDAMGDVVQPGVTECDIGQAGSGTRPSSGSPSVDSSSSESRTRRSTASATKARHRPSSSPPRTPRSASCEGRGLTFAAPEGVRIKYVFEVWRFAYSLSCWAL